MTPVRTEAPTAFCTTTISHTAHTHTHTFDQESDDHCRFYKLLIELREHVVARGEVEDRHERCETHLVVRREQVRDRLTGARDAGHGDVVVALVALDLRGVHVEAVLLEHAQRELGAELRVLAAKLQTNTSTLQTADLHVQSTSRY